MDMLGAVLVIILVVFAILVAVAIVGGGVLVLWGFVDERKRKKTQKEIDKVVKKRKPD